MIAALWNTHPFTLRACKLFALAFAMALVAGCASPSAPSAIDALRNSSPTPGMARLVIFYPPKIIGSDGMAQIKLDDFQTCKLKSGSYLVKEIAPGKQSIAVLFCGMPGVSHLYMKAVAGETYYIRITPYDSSFTGIISGYPSENIPTDTPVHKQSSVIKNQDGSLVHEGPFAIERLDKAVALEALRPLAASVQ